MQVDLTWTPSSAPSPASASSCSVFDLSHAAALYYSDESTAAAVGASAGCEGSAGVGFGTCSQSGPTHRDSMELDRATILYGGLILLYLSLNSALNLSLKLSMARYGFRYPLTLTVSHMAWSAVFLLPLMLTKSYRSKHKETLQKQWAGILGIGTFMAANIALNNSSLVDMTLTLNQIIR